MFMIGIFSLFMDFELDWHLLQQSAKIGHAVRGTSTIGANLFGLGAFLWHFDHGGVPSAIQNAFVQKAGGGGVAQADTNYLYTTLGPSAILALAAVCVALIGILPRIIGILDALALVFVLGTYVAVFIGFTLPWAHGYQSIPSANGQRPSLNPTCTLEPGNDENCESPDPTVQIKLPNPTATTVGCNFQITVGWGDKSATQTFTAKGLAGGTLFTTTHTYAGNGGAYVLSVHEEVTAGHCTANPSSWSPEVAVGVKGG
jgi:hypothetical protein